MIETRTEATLGLNHLTPLSAGVQCRLKAIRKAQWEVPNSGEFTSELGYDTQDNADFLNTQETQMFIKCYISVNCHDLVSHGTYFA